ncbi:MAG: glycosyltransferase [Desulfovibrio sp.]|jgi:glycosyltransferase involved in cell wall biosynthesis|nr:glycosyltransferase [Desulfovibrio sp.]
MRIYYHISDYISHRLSGLEYIDCLRLFGHNVSSRPEDIVNAQVAVIHDDPLNYPGIFARFPLLRELRSIAFCVWENESFPHSYIEPLRLVGEIWTPSNFSRQSMLPHFSVVHVVPHVVRRYKTEPEDIAFAESALGGSDGAFRFFSIVDSINPRKNIRGLLTAFSVLRGRVQRNTVLALKQYRVAMDCSELSGVVSITGDLSQGQMAALHRLCHAYVSAHHAEGWGLGLSDAMAYGKPVIATAYSGNMEYMDEDNSLPVSYTMTPVSAEMCERIPLFRRDMRWAEIDKEAMVLAMKRAVDERLPPELPGRAAEIAKRFSPENVGGIMHGLLTNGASVSCGGPAAQPL